MTSGQRVRSVVAVAVGAGVVVHATVARAQFDPWRLELHWQTPPGLSARCPDERALRARVESLLGHPLDAGSGDRLTARGTVEGTPGGALRVHLVTDHAGERHPRDLDGTDCAALADAAALMLAILVDPAAATLNAPAPHATEPATTVDATAGGTDATAGGTDATMTHAPATSVTASTPAATPAPPRPARVVDALRPPRRVEPPAREIPHSHRGESPPPSPPRFFLRVDAMADLGTLPTLAPGAALASGVRLWRFRVALGAVYLPPQRRLTGTAATSPGGDFQLVAGALTVCFEIAGSPSFALEGCAVGEAGGLAGTGVNVQQPLDGVGPWFAAGPAVGGVWRALPWLGIRLQLGAMIPVFRPPYDVDGVAGTVHQAGPVEARASIGPEFHF